MTNRKYYWTDNLNSTIKERKVFPKQLFIHLPLRSSKDFSQNLFLVRKLLLNSIFQLYNRWKFAKIWEHESVASTGGVLSKKVFLKISQIHKKTTTFECQNSGKKVWDLAKYYFSAMANFWAIFGGFEKFPLFFGGLTNSSYFLGIFQFGDRSFESFEWRTHNTEKQQIIVAFHIYSNFNKQLQSL